MHSRHLIFYPLALLLCFFIACATTGPGGKKSLILISESQEVSIGQGMDQQVRETEKLLPDSLWQAYINDIGQKIVAVSDRSDLPFHFAVIESDQVNAFAAPGGYVYFYSGLIREFESESELVAVMAHEISHVVGRHGVKQLQSIMGVSVLLDLALGESSDQTRAIASTGVGILLQGYSRSQEAEADNFGVTYMVRAGWNPNGAVSMFEKLAAMSGDREAGFFEKLASSHPETKDRIAAVKSQIAAMGQLPPGLIDDSPRFELLKRRLPPK